MRPAKQFQQVLSTLAPFAAPHYPLQLSANPDKV